MRFDIQDYIESKLERPRAVASGHGGEWTAMCPACGKHSKFYVNVDSGKFLCNSCRFSGRSIIALVAHIEGISYSHALRWVFTQSVELPRKHTPLTLLERIRALRDVEEDDDEVAIVNVPYPSTFKPCYKDGKWKLPRYLKERKIKSATARAWGLGMVTRVELEQRDGSVKIMRGPRLLIPIECPAGKSWTARAMNKDVLGPKYLNPSGADHRRMLIGFNHLRFGGDLVICEGPFDAVKLWQHGLPAVALGGKVLHDDQLAQLSEFPRSTAVTIMLDPEELIAPHDIAEKLSVHFKSIYIARLPDEIDPGDSTEAIAHAAMEAAVRWGSRRTGRLVDVLKASRRRMEIIHQ